MGEGRNGSLGSAGTDCGIQRREKRGPAVSDRELHSASCDSIIMEKIVNVCH